MNKHITGLAALAVTVAVILGAIAIAAMVLPSETSSVSDKPRDRQERTNPEPIITDPDNESAVEILADAAIEYSGYTKQQICLAISLGDYDSNFEYFKEGWNSEAPGPVGSITARNVFNELVSRC